MVRRAPYSRLRSLGLKTELNVLNVHDILDIYPLVTRGKYGHIALVRLLEQLVRLY